MPFDEAVRHHQAGRLADAERLYRRILAVDADHAGALHLLGLIAHQAGRNDIAVALMTKAIDIDGKIAACHSNLSLALYDLGRLGDALASCDTALRLDPIFAEAHCNRGRALKDLGRLDDALASCEASLCLKPDLAEALSNRGRALKDLGRLDEALAAYDAALRIRPDFAEAHYNLSFVHLLQGNYPAGWNKYEWRWRGGTKNLTPRSFTQPRWQGEILAERTILLHAEQGLGDAIQFCRYAPLVANQAGRVVLEVPSVLRRILSRLDGVHCLVETGDVLPAFDVHCPLMSLPGICGTGPETVPANIPYLSADPDTAGRILGPQPLAGLKVGIAWRGNPRHDNDRNRSIGLEVLSRLFTAVRRKVTFVSLQKDASPQEKAYLRRFPAVLDVTDRIGDFADTASAIDGLDLVISVDTSVVHLAGALGRTTWVLLPFTPDWRWLMDRDDSPWYPTARLFRQKRRGNWDEVIDRIAEALDSHTSQR